MSTVYDPERQQLCEESPTTVPGYLTHAKEIHEFSSFFISFLTVKFKIVSDPSVPHPGAITLITYAPTHRSAYNDGKTTLHTINSTCCFSDKYPLASAIFSLLARW